MGLSSSVYVPWQDKSDDPITGPDEKCVYWCPWADGPSHGDPHSPPNGADRPEGSKTTTFWSSTESQTWSANGRVSDREIATFLFSSC